MAVKKRNRTLLLGFTLSIFILLASSAASYKSIRELLASLQWVEHTSEVEQNLASIVSMMKDVETGQRGFLLTKRDRFLEPYNTGKDSVWAYYNRAKTLTEDNEQQQKTFDTLSLLLNKKFLLVNQTIETARSGKQVVIDSLEHGKIIMDSIRVVIKTMVDREQQLMVIRTGKFNQFSKYTPMILIVSAILALFITTIFYRRIRSEYQQNITLAEALVQKDESIQRKINKIDSIAQEIAKGNYDIRLEKEDLE